MAKCTDCDGRGYNYGEHTERDGGCHYEYGCSSCGGSGASDTGDLKKGNGCFPKGTKILTPFGHKDISEISKGDIVLSFNPINKKNQNQGS